MLGVLCRGRCRVCCAVWLVWSVVCCVERFECGLLCQVLSFAVWSVSSVLCYPLRLWCATKVASCGAVAPAAVPSEQLINGKLWIRKVDHKKNKSYYFEKKQKKAQWDAPSGWVTAEVCGIASQ